MFWFNESELRAIIEGRRGYKRCPTCGGDGNIYFKELENGDTPQISKQEYSEIGWENDFAGYEGCGICYGVGYVVAFYEDE